MKTTKKRSAKSKKKKIARPRTPERKLRLVYEPIDKLRLWKNNPRRNSEAANKLVASLQEHGFIQPLVVSDGGDGTIWAGNTRFKAAKKAGLTEVPVLYVNFASDEDAENFALVDNKSSEWATWDEDMLAELFGKREQIDGERLERLTGFQPAEIEGIREGDLEGYFGDMAESGPKDGDEIHTKSQGDRSKIGDYRTLVISGERDKMDELRKIVQAAQKKFGVETMAEAFMQIVKDWEKKNGNQVHSTTRARSAKRRI